MATAHQRAVANKNKLPTFQDKTLSKQMDALQGQITTLSSPTADETALQTQAGNIKGSAAMGMAQAQDPTQNPVALGFQTGQAAAIDRQAQAATVPLTTRLALLQSQRADQMKGLQSNLSYDQSKFNTENADWQKQQAAQSAQAIAKTRAQASVDVQAGRSNTALQVQGLKNAKTSAPKSAAPKGQQQVKDAFGNVVGYFDPNTGKKVMY